MKLALCFVFAFHFGSQGLAQVNYSFNFDADALGWTGTFGRFTGATACGGAGGAMRYNLYGSATTANMVSPNAGTSLGGFTTITYDYKAAVWSANTAPQNPWGTFNVQYASSAAGPWTTFATVSQEVQDGSCLAKSHTFVPPAGALFIRWAATWSSGDYYLNFDNIVITESPLQPAPTQAGGIPTCSGGSDLSMTGTPGPNETWYWQTTATGTSTANNATTPWTVFANGTYYVRSFNSLFGLWSTATSVTVSNFPVATTPPAPTAGANPACNSTTLTAAAAPVGEVYYWQTIANGSSNANDAATPLTVSTTGTYYLAAFETASGCWSNTSSIAVTIGTITPIITSATATPAVICSGSTSALAVLGTVPTPSPSYCIPAVGGNGFGITNFTTTGVGTNIANATAVAAYNDYSATMSATRAIGATVGFTVNGNSTHGFSIWVDWNNDGTYAAGEKMFNTTGYVASATGSFVVPGGVINGAHKMRVLGHWLNTNPNNPCEANAYIEIEEYAINVTGGIELATYTWNPGNLVGATQSVSPASTTTYNVVASYMGCSSAPSNVTVTISEVDVALTAINETCIGYENGSFALGTVICGDAPFTYSVDGGAFGTIPTDLAAGTYSVIVQDNDGDESAPYAVVVGSASTYVPAAPTAVQSDYNICSGATSQMIAANGPASGAATITYNGGDGATSYNFGATTATISTCPTSFSIAVPAGATITGVDIAYDMTADNVAYMSEQRSYLRCTSPGGTAEAALAAGVGFTEGTFSYNRTNLTVANGVSSTGTVDFELHAFRTWGNSQEPDCGIYYSKVDNNTLVVTVNYTFPATTIAWYDMASAGTSVGNGSPLESVGTSVLANPATEGSYEFYAESVAGGCISTARTLVTVNVNNVNQELAPFDATCNNGNDGTFAVTNFACGVAPFTYSVDGGAFGAVPLNLTTGTHTVQVMDGNTDLSAIYTITVGSAAGPDNASVDAFDYDQAEISWNGNGSETSWNIEWGLPGFTPGTGTEVGSGTSSTEDFIITGLDGDTQYDIYISANCGGATTPGDWAMTSVQTECDPIVSLPWCEDFEATSSYLQCWSTIDNDADGFEANGYEYSQWTNWTNTDLGDPTFAHSGETVASYFTQFNGTADDYLITPRLTLTGNEVLTFNYRLINPGGVNFKVLLSTTGKDVADFTEVLLADDTYFNDLAWADTAVQLNYTGEVFIAFVREEVLSTTFIGLAIDDVCVDVCIPVAGIDGATDVCRLDQTLDLSGVITSTYSDGQWIFPSNQSVINGSTMNVSTIAAGSYDVSYIKTTACTSDTTIATITVFGPSSAGNDGTLSVCRNEPVNLLAGLSGTIDLGGNWYDPSTSLLANSAITADNVPGQYNYTYITGNGVCPDDTSSILLNVSSTCNYLNVEEMVFAEMTVYPNPSNGIFNIANESSQTFSYEVMDVEGRLVERKEAAVNATSVTAIDMTDKVTGIYMIRVYNGEADKVFRVILH